MRHLSKEQLLTLHTMLCRVSGGAPSLRDEGLLESALYSVEQTFMGEPLYATLLEKGARLGYALIKNHAFVDGNKRIGMLVMLVYFSLVGLKLLLTNEDIVRIGLGVASGEIDYDDLLIFLKEKER